MHAGGVRNDHHREEGNQRGEEHAVDENHEAGALQVLEFGVGDLAVHLRQALFAAHGQQRVAKTDHDGNRRDGGRERALEPSEGFGAELEVGPNRQGHRLVAVLENGDDAPGDQDHHHHGGDLHDAQSFLARFVDPDDVLAPEVKGDDDGEHGREIRPVHAHSGNVQPPAGLIDEAGGIQAGAHGADGAGEHVVEHEGGHRELGEGAAHGFVHHLVHAAAHEHGTAFDVDGAHGVGEQHDGQDEPRRGLSHGRFGDAAHIVGGRSQIAQHDGGGAPEGDERQHYRPGYHHLDGGGAVFNCHVTSPQSSCGAFQIGLRGKRPG